jgi:hypothetical protein
MNRTVKYVLLFLLFDAVLVGGYFLVRALKGGGSADPVTAWLAIDEAYQPRDDVETFIKTDAENRGALPVFIRNHGADPKILGRFRGKQFARPNVSVLGMYFKGLDDWKLVDIKYKNENDREIVRTVLYVFARRQWTVGDTGTLIE